MNRLNLWRNVEKKEMSKMTSRRKIQLGCFAMLLAIIGDYQLGYGTIGTSSAPDAYMGISFCVAPDWRYALSSILGFVCVPFFAVAAVELLRVMEQKYSLGTSGLYRIFRIGNYAGILYFAFIHIGICMLPVVFNAGMDATGDLKTAVDMALRVTKSIAVPLVLGLVVCDLSVAVGWIGMTIKGLLPVKKVLLICNPVCMMLLGQLLNLIVLDMDSGTESLGWLLMYLVSSLTLVERDEAALTPVSVSAG